MPARWLTENNVVTFFTLTKNDWSVLASLRGIGFVSDDLLEVPV